MGEVNDLVGDFRSARKLAFHARKSAETLAGLSSLADESEADAEYALAVYLAEYGPIVHKGRRYESFVDDDELTRVRVTPLQAEATPS